MDMEWDKFDEMAVDIERRTFEVNMAIVNFASELLKTFPDNKAELNMEFISGSFGAKNNVVLVNAIWLDSRDELIYIDAENLNDPILWDDLSLSNRDILVNEIYGQYRANLLYKELSLSGSQMH